MRRARSRVRAAGPPADARGERDLHPVKAHTTHNTQFQCPQVDKSASLLRGAGAEADREPAAKRSHHWNCFNMTYRYNPIKQPREANHDRSPLTRIERARVDRQHVGVTASSLGDGTARYRTPAPVTSLYV